MLITDSQNLANEVSKAISRQTAQLSRKEMIKKVIAKNGILLATAPSIEDGLGLINRFAPEHFELVVRDPEKYLPRVTTAGAVFVGPWTPEPVGDFAAGPSHVLPTGGAGKMFSGLTVEDFRRRTSLVNYTEQDLRDAMPIIEMFGTIEGLDGHKNSAAIRFKNHK
jgi:histidinol dehydrogenase